jgi:hypothetical protein
VEGAPAVDDERIFNPKPWRHYRRRYSVREVQVGAGVWVVLIVVTLWVVWMGRHPDPELFETAPGQANRSPAVVDRGPIPERLAPDGWREASLSRFGPDNLYEKINGREGYYKSFGFRELFFVALQLTEDPRLTVDLEIYDQGNPANALGAFAGELADDTSVSMDDGSMTALRRNAFSMVRGRFLIRAIGSEEGERVAPVFQRVAQRFRTLEAEPLPWAYDVLVQGFGASPRAIQYLPQDAFSFEFATHVYVARLDDEETEVFVRFTPEPDGWVQKFLAGLTQYGTPVAGGWVEDRYLQRVSGARSVDSFVVGVRNAASVAAAEALIERLGASLKALSPERRSVIVNQPSDAPSPPGEEEGYGEGEDE